MTYFEVDESWRLTFLIHVYIDVNQVLIMENCSYR